MYRTDIPDDRVLRKAQKRVDDKKGFFVHFVTYLAVISFLYMINKMTSPEFSWFVFPAGGWGIGLVIHYFTVFGIFGLGSKAWEEKQLLREIERIEDEEGGYLYEYEGSDFPDDSLELKDPEVLRRRMERE